MGQVFLPDPRAQYNALRVLLNTVGAPGLSARKPALFEQCLELLYELAAAPDTGGCCIFSVPIAFMCSFSVAF